MWASELVAVATSNNRQQPPHQAQWMLLKPSPIVMGTIKAFMVRCRSAHKASPSNATRKAKGISLTATMWPCQQTRQGRCEGTVSITTILIPQQWLLPKGHQLPQHVCNKRKLQHFANQRRCHGSYAECNNGNYCHRQHGWRERHKLRDNGGHGKQGQQQEESPQVQGLGVQALPPTRQARQSLVRQVPRKSAPPSMQTTTTSTSNIKKTTQPPWHMHQASRAQQSLDKQQIKLPGRASDIVSSDERTSTSNINKKYHFW